MAGLDDLFAEIPVQDIASKLGADQGEVTNAIKTLVPSLVAGLAQNVQAEDIDSSELESTVAKQGASGLLDGGVSVDQVDESEGDQIVAKIFGGNNSETVASALAGTGAGGGDLIKRLLPILAPIVLAFIGKQFAQRGAAGRGGNPGPGRTVGRARRPAGRAPGRCRRRLAAAASAASWAACSAASRAARSATSSAACSAARGSHSFREAPARRTACRGLSLLPGLPS